MSHCSKRSTLSDANKRRKPDLFAELYYDLLKKYQHCLSDSRKNCGIYKNRWQIEILFKRLKQNFSLKYFLGNTENVIKIQIWVTLMAALILQIIHQMGAKKWAFSHLVSLIKYPLHSDIELFKFLHNPTASFNTITTKILDKPPEYLSLF